MAGNQSAKGGERPVSIESKIKTALNSLGYKIYPGNYNGADETYFVFNHNTLPDDFGDNAPRHERALIQVHLFCPHGFNSVKTRKDAKLALLGAGFTYPNMTDASDKDGQHWVFETETAEGVSEDGED
jgi:hypothetical protein